MAHSIPLFFNSPYRGTHRSRFLRGVGFHTVRRTVSKFRNGPRLRIHREDKCQGTASAVP